VEKQTSRQVFGDVLTALFHLLLLSFCVPSSLSLLRRSLLRLSGRPAERSRRRKRRGGVHREPYKDHHVWN